MAARIIDTPPVVAVSCAAAVFILTAVNRKDIYLWACVMLFFFAVSTVMRPRAAIPQGERLELIVQIAENPTARGRWQQTTARVGFWRDGGYNDRDAENARKVGGEGDDGWRRVNERIQLSVDTCYSVEVGEQIAFRAWVNPVGDGSYGRLMALRGIHSRAYLVPGNLIRKAPHRSETPSYYAAKMQAGAVERLERLDLEPSSRGVVEAMAAGSRGAIERDVRSEYSTTGAAHLLAVSGLHVGIVFVLINLLLYALPAVRRGHIYRNAAAIAAIWAYAAATGLSPSVVRAALMFSFAQLALASGSRRDGLNIMLGSAVVMLAMNPNYWGDPSFMLSYAAVLSIAAFFGPVYDRVRTRWKVLNVLISVMIIGVVASVGTAPLVAYWFGRISLAGMVVNPLVILTAHVIVMFGVVWMAAPVGALNVAFSWVLDCAAGVQNAAVGWAAERDWASVDVGEIPLWTVVAAYVALGAAAAMCYKRYK